MLLFFYLALLTVVFAIGCMCRIPLLVMIAAAMMFFLGFIIAFKLSILFGIMACVVGLVLLIVGAMMV
jgi:hypothetical protein